MLFISRKQQSFSKNNLVTKAKILRHSIMQITSYSYINQAEKQNILALDTTGKKNIFFWSESKDFQRQWKTIQYPIRYIYYIYLKYNIYQKQLLK